MLQNALLFAARWQQLFLPDLTTTEDFTRADGDAVGAQMMNGEFTVAYGEKDGYTAIALPYASDFTAFFVLPPEGDAPTPDGVQAAIAAIGEQVRATVQIPSFDLKVTTDVKSFLEAQGVTALFTDPASLSGIAEGAPVVSAITQQARLIVNESGTVGAALTEIAMTTSLPPEPTHEFRADRPFTMIVQHNDTGVHLFSAYIADPTAE
ncbi:Serpin (serine protease inhibitor) [Ruaniaceae bacterium KH17]|nr:Serpin (serine protease inhibitor) [Ruaniaceae bacterium KH17]